MRVKQNIDIVNIGLHFNVMTKNPKPPEQLRPYHHGALKEAMLTAAERILQEEGIDALTLRRAAREAGASHAAPKNHFGDLTGLLSELAAIGYQKICAVIRAQAAEGTDSQRLLALGRGYIEFARENAALFLLMFRSHRLDHSNPVLKEAVQGAFDVLISAVLGYLPEAGRSDLSLSEAARIASSWARVHGIAMLLLDGHLSGLRPANQADDEALLDAMLSTQLSFELPAKEGA
jgi:AcrR family transcriptional regulator